MRQPLAFADPYGLVVDDPRHSVGEVRVALLGHAESGRLLAVMFTERGDRTSALGKRLVASIANMKKPAKRSTRVGSDDILREYDFRKVGGTRTRLGWRLAVTSSSWSPMWRRYSQMPRPSTARYEHSRASSANAGQRRAAPAGDSAAVASNPQLQPTGRTVPRSPDWCGREDDCLQLICNPLGGLHPDLFAGLEAADISPAPMDNREDLDALRAHTANHAVGTFEDFTEGGIGALGYVTAGAGKVVCN